MEQDTRDKIIKSISLSGSAEESEALFIPKIARYSTDNIGVNSSLIVDRAHGLPRLKNHIIPRFNLILSQPLSLAALSNLEIRCYLCGRVISYPCWYYKIEFAVNAFHYFICFDETNSLRVTSNCNRRIK